MNSLFLGDVRLEYSKLGFYRWKKQAPKNLSTIILVMFNT